MGYHRGSTVFVNCPDLDTVEQAVLELLHREDYTHGAMKNIPVCVMAPGQNGWTLLRPEETFDFLTKDASGSQRSRLARLARLLGCDCFQLDASDYNVGLYEVNNQGDCLVSGRLHVWDRVLENDLELPDFSQEEVAMEVFLRHATTGITAFLRAALCREPEDFHEVITHTLRLTKKTAGHTFDPRDDDPEFSEEQTIIFKRPRRFQGPSRPRGRGKRPK